MPSHIYRRWRLWNSVIDLMLAADVRPWALAEAACAAIAGEWLV